MASPLDSLGYHNALANAMQNQLAQSQASALSGLFSGSPLQQQIAPNSVLRAEDIKRIYQPLVEPSTVTVDRIIHDIRKYGSHKMPHGVWAKLDSKSRSYLSSRFRVESEDYSRVICISDGPAVRVDPSPPRKLKLPTGSDFHHRLRLEIENWLPRLAA